ncbi:MAG: hypothetical protein RSC28_07930 [Bacteroidales bacterium]
MSDLEKYIKENSGLFNSGNLPEGHKERFMAKLKTPKHNNVLTLKYSTIIGMCASVAAILIVTFVLGDFSKQNEKQNISVINANIYEQEMQHEKTDVIKLAKQMDTNVEEQALTMLDNITFEAIPLSEQLPNELSIEQKAKILKEYYKQKTEGIKKIKIFLAQEISNNEE